MRRKNLSREQEAYLERYFGRACAITGSVDFTWHHLDDDASNTVIENVIPIGSRLNVFLCDAHLRRSKGAQAFLLAELAPDYLTNHAKVLFDQWELGRAYACARLSSFIAAHYLSEPASRRLPRSCQALYFCLHRLNYAFMRDVLSPDVMLCLMATKSLRVELVED